MKVERISVIELESRRTMSLDATLADERMHLPMHAFQGDCLYVISGN